MTALLQLVILSLSTCVLLKLVPLIVNVYSIGGQSMCHRPSIFPSQLTLFTGVKLRFSVNELFIHRVYIYIDLL